MSGLKHHSERIEFDATFREILVRDRDTDEEKLIWQGEFDGVDWEVRGETLEEVVESFHEAVNADDVEPEDFASDDESF